MATIQSSDLDFDAIKSTLKTYLQQQSEFVDYDFEASGLSNLLDVLAHNTHINGLIANMGINESFLSSAQVRSSVVSHAENLGYHPSSKTGAKATVNLSISTSDLVTTTVTLPKFTAFTSTIDDVAYTFRTLEAVTATNNGAGLFSFVNESGGSSIEICEGRFKTKRFFVGDVTDDRVYVIPDTDIDINTMQVDVFETATSSIATKFSNIDTVARIDTTSTVYIVREAPNGFYEVTFSEGNVLGKAPEAGNRIEISYLAGSGEDANGGSIFTANNQVSVNSVDYTLNVTTVSNSAGGSEKETIKSIKANAPLTFAAQQRLVTAEDYKALILSNYSNVVEDVISWGGNDNVPPIYGRVYVSIDFKDGVSADAQTTTKNNIVSQLSDNLSIMSIDTEFVDPAEVFLEIETTFNFDPDLSSQTNLAAQTSVQNKVTSFINSNLSGFGKTFRRSNLLAEIDALDQSILNSQSAIKMQVRFTPTADEMGLLTDYTSRIQFPVKILAPDSLRHSITTTEFTHAGVTASIKNKLSSNTLQLISSGDVILDNVGSFNSETGAVNLTGLTIGAPGDTPVTIKFTAVPADESTIKPLRNYVVKLDTDLSFSTAVVDFQNTTGVIR